MPEGPEQTSWHSQPKVYAVGHASVKDVNDWGPVVVEEKIDGSQIQWGVFDGELRIRSKGRNQHEDTDKMFTRAVESIEHLRDTFELVNGWTYRGEYLNSPHHNGLTYNRTPRLHVILFDICIGQEDYVDREILEHAAVGLGLDVVPVLWRGDASELSIVKLKSFLDTVSVLGGPTIEGVVIKPLIRDRFGRDGKLLMAKYVSRAFVELQRGEFAGANRKQQDIVVDIGERLRTTARWDKAVQRMRDDGTLKGTPQDIGPLIKSIQHDVVDEEEEWIKEMLYRNAVGDIRRKVGRGFPEWYKDKLARESVGMDRGEHPRDLDTAEGG